MPKFCFRLPSAQDCPFQAAATPMSAVTAQARPKFDLQARISNVFINAPMRPGVSCSGEQLPKIAPSKVAFTFRRRITERPDSSPGNCTCKRSASVPSHFRGSRMQSTESIGLTFYWRQSSKCCSDLQILSLALSKRRRNLAALYFASSTGCE